MVKITAVQAVDVRAHGWGKVRTASLLWQLSLKFLKTSSETKLQLKCLLACVIISVLLCPKELVFDRELSQPDLGGVWTSK